jgi:hypothetical protein
VRQADFLQLLRHGRVHRVGLHALEQREELQVLARREQREQNAARADSSQSEGAEGGARPERARARLCCGQKPRLWRISRMLVVMERPLMSAVPDVGSSMPISMEMVVVLPAPLWPRSPNCAGHRVTARA